MVMMLHTHIGDTLMTVCVCVCGAGEAVVVLTLLPGERQHVCVAGNGLGAPPPPGVPFHGGGAHGRSGHAVLQVLHPGGSRRTLPAAPAQRCVPLDDEDGLGSRSTSWMSKKTDKDVMDVVVRHEAACTTDDQSLQLAVASAAAHMGRRSLGPCWRRPNVPGAPSCSRQLLSDSEASPTVRIPQQRQTGTPPPPPAPSRRRCPPKVVATSSRPAVEPRRWLWGLSPRSRAGAR